LSLDSLDQELFKTYFGLKNECAALKKSNKQKKVLKSENWSGHVSCHMAMTQNNKKYTIL